MKLQVWLLAVFAIAAEAAGPVCYTKFAIFGSRDDNPMPWIVRDWNLGCAKLPAAANTDCTTISRQITMGIATTLPADQVLFNFKTSAMAFVKKDSAYPAILATQIRKAETDNWGTVQELFTCLDTDCGILTYALGQQGQASKIGAAMKAACETFFPPATEGLEFGECLYTAGIVTGSADVKAILDTLLDYTKNNTNTKRKDFLNTIKIETWGGTVGQSLECAGAAKCDQLLPLLVYYQIEADGLTKFTKSMNDECYAKFPIPPIDPKNAQCVACYSAILREVRGNQTSTLSGLATAYNGCKNDPEWKADFSKVVIASWGTVVEAAACSAFVPPTAPTATSTISTGSSGSPGSTASTTAAPNPDCLASRKELLQKATSGEYKIIAPLVAACAARLNATEQAECTKTVSAMTAIVSSTSTADDKKLLDLTTELIKFGNATSERANIIVTTEIPLWNVAAGEKTYIRFITCQSQGNCELSQIMFAPLPNGESYASTKLMIACQRNNSPALCTTLMNEVKKCTQGPLNFMPATEWDRIVRAQSILSSSTTKIDANAPFGDWGTVGQFTACK